MTWALDLSAYFARVGFAAEAHPDLATLRSLHRAHRLAVPFENLDIQMGEPIRLDLESLEAKLVHHRRGGYCFEQNTFFLSVLKTIGFKVRPLLGRVRFGAPMILPRTHMILKVDLTEGPFLADVGFGAEGLLEPIPLVAGPETQQGFESYRLHREAERWVLEGTDTGVWKDFYAFTEEEQHPIDFEVANHYTSTHPESRFVQTLTAQAVTPDRQLVLRNLKLTTATGQGKRERELKREELIPFLNETFGIVLPEPTRFKALD